jgi:hypothetical protein
MAGAAIPAVAPASNLLRDNFIDISSSETTVTVESNPLGKVPVFAKPCQGALC